MALEEEELAEVAARVCNSVVTLPLDNVTVSAITITEVIVELTSSE